MVIGTEEISTPADTPHAYSTLWRHDAAAAMLNSSTIHPLFSDDYIFAQVQYLKTAEDSGLEAALDRAVSFSSKPCSSPLYVIAKANSVFQTSNGAYTRERIEALLLCPELTYHNIAEEFNLSDDVVRTFEKLFFNVRDDEGKLLGSKGLLIYCALKGASAFRPDRPNHPETDAMYWRVLAFENGYKSLYSVWGFRFDKLPGFTDVDFHCEIMRNLFRCLDKIFRYSNRISLKDVSNLVGTLSERFAEMRKSGILSNKDVVDEKGIMMELVRLLVPTRLLEDAGLAEARQLELDSKLTSVKFRDRRLEDGTPEAFQKITAQLAAAPVKQGDNYNVQGESHVGSQEGGGLP